MGLCRRLSDFTASSSRAATMAAPLQLASTTWQYRLEATNQSPRPNPRQPVEAPHLASCKAHSDIPTGRVRDRRTPTAIAALINKPLRVRRKGLPNGACLVSPIASGTAGVSPLLGSAEACAKRRDHKLGFIRYLAPVLLRSYAAAISG